MTFRTIDCRSLNRRLCTVMAAPSSIDSGRVAPMLDEYRQLGGNGLHLHGEGGETHSREATGQWLRQRGCRSEFFICTPVGHAGWDEQASRPIRRLDAAAFAEDISIDLDLLSAGYLDLVYLSEDDPTLPVEVILEPLIAEQRSGRIRAFGASQWSAPRIREANRWAQQRSLPKIAALVTTELALLTPSEPLWPEYVPFDAAMKDCVRTEGLTVFAWLSDLNQGMCRFGASDPVTTMKPAWVRRWQHQDNDRLVKRVTEFAATRSLNAREINTAYVLNQSFPVVGIVALGVPHCGDLATYARSSQVVLSKTDRVLLETCP